MATSPAFAVTPRIGAVLISTAETNFITISNYGELLTGAASGTRVSEVVCKAGGTSAAGIVRLYIHDGTANWFVDEFTISAAAGAGNTAQTTRVSNTYNNMILPGSGHKLRVTTTIAQPIHVTAYGADL